MNVLLLRNPPQGTPDRYHECLSSLGFSPHSIPVLDTVLTGFERMKDILLGATYDGVIVTSSRSAEAWKEVVGELLKNDLQSEASWSEVPFYVVGSTTANALRSIPNSRYTPSPVNIRGAESGSGEALARFIVDDLESPDEKRLLYLTGDKNRDTLPKILRQAGIELDDVQVYETRGSPAFENDLKALLGDETFFDPSNWWIVFFAPSSADFVLPFLKIHFRFVSKGAPRVAAIGPTTLAYLRNHLHLFVDVTPDNPTPEALGEAIKSNKINK